MSFPEGLCHAPEFFEYHFLTECSIMDEFPRNRPDSCRGEIQWFLIKKFYNILKLMIGWVFQESVKLMHRKCASKGLAFFRDSLMVSYWPVRPNWSETSHGFHVLVRPKTYFYSVGPNLIPEVSIFPSSVTWLKLLNNFYWLDSDSEIIGNFRIQKNFGTSC